MRCNSAKAQFTDSIFGIPFKYLSTVKERAGAFDIKVLDANYSMAYTTYYQVWGDSILVKALNSGIEGEKDSILLSKSLSGKDVDKICQFLSSLSFNEIEKEYKNPLIQDGDIKKVRIAFNDKRKDVEIKNVYQRDMADLFNLLNTIIGKSGVHIEYKKEGFATFKIFTSTT